MAASCVVPWAFMIFSETSARIPWWLKRSYSEFIIYVQQIAYCCYATAGIGNLSRKPDTGSERIEMKSRVAAFLKTKSLHQNIK